MPVGSWKPVLNCFMIEFKGRLRCSFSFYSFYSCMIVLQAILKNLVSVFNALIKYPVWDGGLLVK